MMICQGTILTIPRGFVVRSKTFPAVTTEEFRFRLPPARSRRRYSEFGGLVIHSGIFLRAEAGRVPVHPRIKSGFAGVACYALRRAEPKGVSAHSPAYAKASAGRGTPAHAVLLGVKGGAISVVLGWSR
jgi:hypothetical protein